MDKSLNDTNADANPLPDQTRILIYQWLGGLFGTEITVEAIKHYRSDEGRQFFALVAAATTASTAVSKLESLLSDNDDMQSLELDLSGAYSRLFLGAGGKRTAPPYQSVFQSDTARIFQASTVQMEEVLRSLDMRLPEGFVEPADHIAVQLNVMARLIEVGDRARQSDFLMRHLEAWVSRFAEACQAHDTTGFYAAAATILDQWISKDQAALEQTNSEMNDRRL